MHSTQNWFGMLKGRERNWKTEKWKGRKDILDQSSGVEIEMDQHHGEEGELRGQGGRAWLKTVPHKPWPLGPGLPSRCHSKGTASPVKLGENRTGNSNGGKERAGAGQLHRGSMAWTGNQTEALQSLPPLSLCRHTSLSCPSANASLALLCLLDMSSLETFNAAFPNPVSSRHCNIHHPQPAQLLGWTNLLTQELTPEPLVVLL